MPLKGPHLTVAQSREIDWRAKSIGHIPGLILMENAGRGMAEILLAKRPQGTVVVCCGGGNNGGDGFVIARHLDGAGVPVQVLLFTPPEKLQGDAAINFFIIANSTIPFTIVNSEKMNSLDNYFGNACWLVDALVGTGQSGPLRPPFNRVVESMNGSGKPIFAVDIPSGMDGDTGQPGNPTVKATLTATMVTPKIGFQNAQGQPFLGEVCVVGIGLPSCHIPK